MHILAWFLAAWTAGHAGWTAGATVPASGREAGAPAGGEGARVAINTATVEELQRLPGIGPKKAARIVEARGERPFRRPSDLRRVPGFGVRTVRRLAPLVEFGRPAARPGGGRGGAGTRVPAAFEVDRSAKLP